MKPLLWICSVALALSAVSCARLLFGQPTKLFFSYEGVEKRNAADRDESKPVEIRFFLLKDSVRFQKAAFKDLGPEVYKATLGDEVVGESLYLSLHPSPRYGLALGVSPPQVKFLGMVATITRPDGSLTQDRAWVPRNEIDYYAYEIKDYRLVVTRQ